MVILNADDFFLLLFPDALSYLSLPGLRRLFQHEEEHVASAPHMVKRPPEARATCPQAAISAATPASAAASRATTAASRAPTAPSRATTAPNRATTAASRAFVN